MNYGLETVRSKYKFFSSVLFFFLGIIVFIFHVWLPQQAEIHSLEKALSETEKKIAAVETFAGQNSDSQKLKDQFRQKLLLTEQLLPDNMSMGEFLVELERTAEASKVQIGQVQPAQAIQRNGYQETLITMTVRGDYFMVLDFLRRIEGGKRFLALSSISLQSKSGDFLEGKLTVLVYHYSNNSAAAAAR